MTVYVILYIFTAAIIHSYHLYMNKPCMNNDQIGKIAELQFDVDCSKKNLYCAWPSIDKNGYDCIVDNGERLIKVQIKSSSIEYIKGNDTKYYSITIRKGMGGRDEYTNHCFDVLAIYLHPIDTWYLLPFSDINSGSIKLYPGSDNSKWNKYVDNWGLLKAPTH